MNINLHIERLVVDGLDIEPGQRHRLQPAIEAELRRLFSQGQLRPELMGGVAVPRIDVAPIRTSPAAGPADLGRQIAGSIHGGVAK